MKTNKKCPNCNKNLILITNNGCASDNNMDKWPLVCLNCYQVYSNKLNLLNKETKSFTKLMNSRGKI